MAVGAVTSDLVSKAQNEYLDLQPAAGTEWVIHNIYYSQSMELYWYDGANTIKFDSDASYGARYGMCFHCTNSNYVRVKNVYAGTAYIGYDGIITAEAA